MAKKKKTREDLHNMNDWTDADFEALTELGECEMTNCGDSGRYGLIVWTGTKDEYRAKKIANRVIANVNASPYGPIAKLRKLDVGHSSN